MATLDVFNSDAFSSLSLTHAIEKVPHLPTMLGDMGIFEDKPIRTTHLFLEERDGVLGLIQTDSRGAAPSERKSELRKVRAFETRRIAHRDTITAGELQNIRAFGSETEMMAVQAEVMRRMVGPTGISAQIQYTWENHRLGAIQGLVVDANGNELDNWYANLGITQDAEIDFDLDNASPASGALIKKCSQVKRQMSRNAKGAMISTTQIHALCGDAFYDDLRAHSEVRETYKNWSDAAELRNPVAWERFVFGGITWWNYRGSDDNSEIAVGTDKAKFFPVGAPGVFQVAWGPGEGMDHVNQLGRPLYSYVIPDRNRNFSVGIEMYSYPLFYCTRPGMLQRGKRT